MLELYQELTDAQSFALFLAALSALGWVLSKVINYFILLSQSNSDRHNSNDVHRATDRAQIDHNTDDIKHIDNRVSDLERKD